MTLPINSQPAPTADSWAYPQWAQAVVDTFNQLDKPSFSGRRQVVKSGKVASDGTPDYLSESGLSIGYLATATPLRLHMAAGFLNGKPFDYEKILSADAAAQWTVNKNMQGFAVLEYDPNTDAISAISTPHRPVYSYTEPTADELMSAWFEDDCSTLTDWVQTGTGISIVSGVITLTTAASSVVKTIPNGAGDFDILFNTYIGGWNANGDLFNMYVDLLDASDNVLFSFHQVDSDSGGVTNSVYIEEAGVAFYSLGGAGGTSAHTSYVRIKRVGTNVSTWFSNTPFGANLTGSKSGCATTAVAKIRLRLVSLTSVTVGLADVKMRYSSALASAPSTGQYWYSINEGKWKTYVGGSWVEKVGLCIGEAQAMPDSSSALLYKIPYAFDGCFVSTFGMAASAATVKNHYLGTPHALLQVSAISDATDKVFGGALVPVSITSFDHKSVMFTNPNAITSMGRITAMRGF